MATRALCYGVARPGSEVLPRLGAIYRSTVAVGTPTTAEDVGPNHPFVGLAKGDSESLYHSFRDSVQRFADKPALGVQPMVNGEAQPYKWITYAQLGQRVDAFGAGLMHLGLLPVSELNDQPMIAIYMRNSIDWVVAQYAGAAFRAVLVAFYDTLGADSTQYILNQTELATVVCTSAELKKLVQIRPQCRHLKTIVISGDVDGQAQRDAQALGLVVLRMSDVEKLGVEHPRSPTPPKHHDVATIMYTSGTTGDPKGAILTNGNLLATVASSIDNALTNDLRPPELGQRHMSYLPLAHIFERAVQLAVLIEGGKIGFSQGNPLKVVDDLKAMRPTVFPVVPRVLNRMYDGVMAKLATAPTVKRLLAQIGMSVKLKRLNKQGKARHKLWDRLVFRKIAASFGLDKCLLVLCGSAPLSPDVLAFARIVFPCVVLEGYGQTETSATITTSLAVDLSCGYVGAPVSCNEVRLESVPDMGYLVTDREHGEGSNRIPCVGRGEICCRGPNVFSGYFKLPDKTAEAIDADGWLHTGDIGLWSPLGQLKIIDRKKNIFKLSQGEYVAPEKVENALTTTPIVAQIFVTGDSLHSHLVAIVVPDEPTLRRHAQTMGINAMPPVTFAELCTNDHIRRYVLQELDAASTKAKLAGFERVKQVYLHPDLFTAENELLTPTFKLRRNDAQKFFKKQIDDMYALSGDHVGGK